MFVDFAGDTVPVTNPDMGEIWNAQICVLIRQPRHEGNLWENSPDLNSDLWEKRVGPQPR